ncbi:hypothetical protein [Streptomyces sp. NPDC007205]|uniref:hypothetical protein n=1 Tax=Streptomyces sp. NPDC007205 TaxID=3154316 RepID=UPI0033F87DF8
MGDRHDAALVSASLQMAAATRGGTVDQARRRRSTDRTLTRRSFAITPVFSPAANRSPA